MNDFLNEELQETLLELEKARSRERKLAEESDAVLSAITALADAKNRHQIFDALLTVLKKYIHFDNALVLAKSEQDSSYNTFLCTNSLFENTTWNEDPKFARAIKGECIVLFDPGQVEFFKRLNPIVKNTIQSALICGVVSEVSQSVIVLISNTKGRLNTESKDTLTRLMPLVERALHDIDQKERLQQLVQVRTKELANNRQRFIDFAQSVGDWLWETDAFLNVHYQTSSRSSIVKINDNLLTGLEKICHPEGLSRIEQAISQIKPFEEIEVELNGQRFISVSGRPYFNEQGTYKGYRGSAKDITDKKARIIELESAKAEALKASNAKSEFLAVMSHEIRTPLNTILGYLDVLQNAEFQPNQSRILEQMESSAELLNVLISDILDLSKIESGHFSLNFQEANLPSIVANSINHHRVHADSKGIAINIDIDKNIPEFILIDPVRLTQILFNLVGNAVKFTCSGCININVSILGVNKIEIKVSDTGIGIADSKIGLLFNAFEQADSSITREYGGTGLGLTITRHLVELMGGSITVTSKVNRGSEFKVVLPITPVKQKTSETEKEYISQKTELKKILLVEDNKTNQKVIQILLEKLGHNVELACNGLEATNIISTRPEEFDLIFMDLSMPVMDGLKATEIIREHAIQTHIIALTAHALETDKEKCLSAGMNGFLTKPIRMDELKKILNKSH
ncbi:ATP-binding protein [Vibrio hannami]|uniref:response regulator n=1 Tax=Vibrio hannami TaxID=2717094 RepID=UPI00240F9A44|nr:response regulator [Vibrio hannami]MDG3088131.1 ATP-binding protein [Vibrio hannami]